MPNDSKCKERSKITIAITINWQSYLLFNTRKTRSGYQMKIVTVLFSIWSLQTWPPIGNVLACLEAVIADNQTIIVTQWTENSIQSWQATFYLLSIAYKLYLLTNTKPSFILLRKIHILGWQPELVLFKLFENSLNRTSRVHAGNSHLANWRILE